jgi:hypothetical protein
MKTLCLLISFACVFGWPAKAGAAGIPGGGFLVEEA